MHGLQGLSHDDIDDYMKRLILVCCLGCVFGYGPAGYAHASDTPDWGQMRRDIDAGAHGPDDAAFEARRRHIRERARAHFAAADRDGDGKLSREEVAQLRPFLARHFDRIDTDHDGLLSERELADAWRHMPPRRHAHPVYESPLR